MNANYILAVLQNASDGTDLERKQFPSVKDAADWLKSHCNRGKTNGTLFEINSVYDYSVGFVEYSSCGEPVTKSFDADCQLLYKNQANL